MMNHMNLIRNYNHDFYIIDVNKKALSPNSGKRYVQDNGISSLLYHRDISII